MNDDLDGKTGVYIAYRTTSVPKPIYKASKTKKAGITMVNNQCTNVGITADNFGTRRDYYIYTFDNEIEFIPLAVVHPAALRKLKKRILSEVKWEFDPVGQSLGWFNTFDRRRVREIIAATLAASRVKYDYIGDQASP